MIIALLYYSIAFLVSIFMISRMLIVNNQLDGERRDINNIFAVLCLCFISWSVSIVINGISRSDVLDKAFLLVADFFKICAFVAGSELCAAITDTSVSKRKSINVISSELLYLGVFSMIFSAAMNRVAVSIGPFGKNLDMKMNIAFLIYLLFYVVVIFFYCAYSYMHYYINTNKREHFISKYCAVIVGVVVLAICIETVAYIQYHVYVPSMYIAMMVCIFVFRNLILYKRSIEYNEVDYQNILAPSHEKPAFVCDDEGIILYENTRAFVMRQTYKDEYVGKKLTDIFEITDYDKERLIDNRLTQFFSIYCKYPKEPKEMLLTVKHNQDRFGDIFTTEVEVEFANANVDEQVVPVVASSNNLKENIRKKVLLPTVTIEEISDIRTKDLISLLEKQKKYYDDSNRRLFELNLIGIEKSAEVQGLSALQDLCDRIKTELKFGEWEGLNPLMIDLDRQYETLLFLQ